MPNKNYMLQCFAEKPDIFAAIPAEVLSLEQIEEYSHIPRLAIGELTVSSHPAAFFDVLQRLKPDAFMPTISYTGTEWGQWRATGKAHRQLKKTIEKEFNIYVTPPVLLGSPGCWWALNGRFQYELYHRFGFHCICYGCRIYSLALRIPLCKRVNARLVISGSASDKTSHKTYNSSQSWEYYHRFLSSFGIELHSFQGNLTQPPENAASCVFKENYIAADGSYQKPSMLSNYFEDFAIPAMARIVSKALAGTDIDYVSEVEKTLLPAPMSHKRKKAAKTARK